MGSCFEGLMLDSSKCIKMSMDEKRELVHQLSKWSQGAPEVLQSWSRQEILEILCAEMGKDRKYTGLTKMKIIEQLLRVVSEKKLQELGTSTHLEPQSSLESGQRTLKRQRKFDNPSRFPPMASNVSSNNIDGDLGNSFYCKNLACRAKLSDEDAFCKRCSCCICKKYDDNKDPSLWLVCCSDPPFQGYSCGMSCHLDCALRHERSGITKDRLDTGLNGSFHCVSCGKINDMVGCWRKQLITARDTRRVDILCYRLSLSQKLLFGTKSYKGLCEIVDKAVDKLEEDVGPLTGLPVKMARGIVNRLSSGPEVQRLCASAVDFLDSTVSNTILNMPSDGVIQGPNTTAANLVKFKDIGSCSLTLVLGTEHEIPKNVIMWHRKADDPDYPAEPTFTALTPITRYLLSGLSPATEYRLKVVCYDNCRELEKSEVAFRTNSAADETSHPSPKSLVDETSRSPPTNCSSLSNPSSVEDENNNIVPCSSENENGEDANTDKSFSANLSDNIVECTATAQRGTPLEKERTMDKVSSLPNSDVETVLETDTDNRSNVHVQNGTNCATLVDRAEADLPITPCKLENVKDAVGRDRRLKLGNDDLDNGSGKEEEPQAGSSSKKRNVERRDGECSGIGDKDFEYYVKVIRWLECDGHIETAFRQKFLTWYSLRATPQQVRIVKAFVDTLVEDPESLAGQLVDTFSDVISSKRSSTVPSGFCLRLWH